MIFGYLCLGCGRVLVCLYFDQGVGLGLLIGLICGVWCDVGGHCVVVVAFPSF